MAFIIDNDYLILIQAEQLEQITDDPALIAECLAQAEEEVKEYTRHRFDMVHEMRTVNITADGLGITASAEDRFYNQADKLFYLCIKDATGQDLNNSEYFTQTDDRNKKLIQVVTDVFLYHLHTRLNPRNIPTHRVIRYDGNGNIETAMSATKWLLMVQKGTLTPDLKVYKDEDGEPDSVGHSVIYGTSSNPDKYKI